MENERESIIIGYLQGRLHGKEQDDFYAWLDEDPAHKRLFFEVKAVYDACRPLLLAEETERSWQRLLKKRARRGAPFRVTLFRISAYAAVALLAAAITSLLFLYGGDEKTPHVTSYVGGDGLEADMVVLPDGSRVRLGSQTTFSYDDRYGAADRVVHLVGEAYFEVAKQADKPFIVRTKEQDIEALGTKFNVSAYPTDSLLTTTLLEGSVRLTSATLGNPVLLSPDEQLVYNRNTHATTLHKVDAGQFVSWTTGYYYFPEQSLSAILYRLGHIYGFTFTVRSEALAGRHFTGTFYRGQSMKDILDIIRLSIPIRYRIDDRRIEIDTI